MWKLIKEKTTELTTHDQQQKNLIQVTKQLRELLNEAQQSGMDGVTTIMREAKLVTIIEASVAITKTRESIRYEKQSQATKTTNFEGPKEHVQQCAVQRQDSLPV